MGGCSLDFELKSTLYQRSVNATTHSPWKVTGWLGQHIFTKMSSETFYIPNLDHHYKTITLTSFKAEYKYDYKKGKGCNDTIFLIWFWSKYLWKFKSLTKKLSS